MCCYLSMIYGWKVLASPSTGSWNETGFTVQLGVCFLNNMKVNNVQNPADDSVHVVLSVFFYRFEHDPPTVGPRIQQVSLQDLCHHNNHLCVVRCCHLVFCIWLDSDGVNSLIVDSEVGRGVNVSVDVNVGVNGCLTVIAEVCPVLVQCVCSLVPAPPHHLRLWCHPCSLVLVTGLCPTPPDWSTDNSSTAWTNRWLDTWLVLCVCVCVPAMGVFRKSDFLHTPSTKYVQYFSFHPGWTGSTGWTFLSPVINDVTCYTMSRNVCDESISDWPPCPPVCIVPECSVLFPGQQVRGFLASTLLTQPQLASIWWVFTHMDLHRSGFTGCYLFSMIFYSRTLADVDKDGKLKAEEFILAMHLVDVAKSGHPLPLILPTELVPPSHRWKSTLFIHHHTCTPSPPLQPPLPSFHVFIEQFCWISAIVFLNSWIFWMVWLQEFSERIQLHCLCSSDGWPGPGTTTENQDQQSVLIKPFTHFHFSGVWQRHAHTNTNMISSS